MPAPERPIWILERLPSERFPYRVRIVRGKETLLALRAQERWPGAGQSFFCLRDVPREGDDSEHAYEVERVPVLAVDQYGKRLAIVLDRRLHKRCDFLFLVKTARNGARTEQIYWRTETALRQRRPTRKLTLDGRGKGFTVVVDSRERYAWTFPGCEIERRALAVGDYALLRDGVPVAVVERKTEDHLLNELGRLPGFHQALGELEKVPGHALVIEADYARILDPKRWPAYTPAFRAKAIAEIFAFHPALRVVFASSRKLANEWTRAYFKAWHENATTGAVPLFEAAATRRPAVKRIVRNRRLTSEEAARYDEARKKIDAELPEIVARHQERMGWLDFMQSEPEGES